MADRGPHHDLDHAFEGAQAGDVEAFTAWVRLVEIPLRASLRSFAAAVDVEAIVQETLLWAWRRAPSLSLQGEGASLRYTIVVARHLASHHVEKAGRQVPLDEVPEPTVPPAPARDPKLREAIRACVDHLSPAPRRAILARVEGAGELPDRDLAVRLRMTTNTFLKNLSRAREHLRECLSRSGYPLEEVLR